MRHLGRGLQNFRAEVLHRADAGDSLDGSLNLVSLLLKGSSLDLCLDLYRLLLRLDTSGWRATTVCLVNAVGKHANGASWHERCGPLAAVAHVLQVLGTGQLHEDAS